MVDTFQHSLLTPSPPPRRGNQLVQAPADNFNVKGGVLGHKGPATTTGTGIPQSGPAPAAAHVLVDSIGDVGDSSTLMPSTRYRKIRTIQR